MHAIVCIKQVPDVSDVKIDRQTNTLIREGVPSIVNPVDLNAIEEAVRIKEKYGGKVTAISMGPPQAADALKEAIRQGADEGILISDPAYAGSDTYATSYILSEAIKRIWAEEGIDLILCGKQAIDGETGQVPPGIATRLKIPLLSYVYKIEKIDFDNKIIIVKRKLDRWRETIKSRIPALISVIEEINKPRYSSLDYVIKAARYKVKIWDKKVLNLDLKKTGLAGSPTRVIKISTPSIRKKGVIINDVKKPEEAASLLAEKIAIVLKGG